GRPHHAHRCGAEPADCRRPVERIRGTDALLGLTPLGAVPTLIWDGRYSLSTAVLAGFGRAIAEVGAIIIVGGNIAGYTRTMTTAISVETSRGGLPLGMALGLGLDTIAISINAAATTLSNVSQRVHSGA